MYKTVKVTAYAENEACPDGKESLPSLNRLGSPVHTSSKMYV